MRPTADYKGMKFSEGKQHSLQTVAMCDVLSRGRNLFVRSFGQTKLARHVL
jgi:hypothetical protein